MKKNVFSLLMLLSASAAMAQLEYYSFTRVSGMFAYNNSNPYGPGSALNNSITECYPGDSVFFLTNLTYQLRPDSNSINFRYYLDNTNYGSVSYNEVKKNRLCNSYASTPCDGLEYGEGTYKIFFKIPEFISPGLHSWYIYPGNPANLTFYFTIKEPLTSIKEMQIAGKDGTLTVYELSGKLIRENRISNYTDGLEKNRLYIYKAVFEDNTFASGKFVIE